MRIITKTEEMNKALNVVGNTLETSYGASNEMIWKFPDGTSAPFPTWLLAQRKLAVGFSADHLMNSGRPITLALRTSTPIFTPTVEINIPPHANQSVQGCFAFDEHEQLWLCHRGSKLTVQAYQRKRLTKKMIHDYFRNWLAPAREQIGTAPVRQPNIIRITPLPTKHLQHNLRCFAEHIERLKNAWIKHEGDNEKMMRFTLRNSATRDPIWD